MAEKRTSNISDVADPGSSSPTASSRPIIMERHPTTRQDPMIAEAKNEAGANKAATVAPPSVTRKVISPLTKPAEDVASTPSTEITEENSVSSESAVIDAVAGQTSDKKQEAALAEEEKQRLEAVRKLIQDKTYFLPIGETKAKRNVRFSSIAILIVVLVLAGGYAALNMGVIKTNLPIPLLKK